MAIIYRNQNYLVKQSLFHRWLIQPDGTTHTKLCRFWPSKPKLEYMRPMLRVCTKDAGQYLLLGLGGGALIHSLKQKLKSPVIDVVEVDPDIIHIAKQYFYLDTVGPLNLFQDDAFRYLDETPNKYDSILVDVYHDRSVPDHCATPEFFDLCKQKICSDGVVAINCANMSQYKLILNAMKQVYGTSLITVKVPHPRNVIIIAGTQPLQSIIELASLKTVQWHEDFGVIGF